MQKEKLVRLFNELKIEDMPEVTELHELKGDFINVEFQLPGGQKIKMWDDEKTYLGAELCKKNSERCYGLVADENYLFVCEYGNKGSDAEIVLMKRL